MIIKKTLSLCLSAVFFLSTTLRATVPSQQELDTLAQKTIAEWHIPGLGLAVVYKGKAYHVSGYGVRQAGLSERVNKETLFQIASLTKAYTAASANLLVQNGTLEWERPIIDYLPDFKLKDNEATRTITLRDLLSHRTGLPGTSKLCWMLWSHTDRTSEDLIRRLEKVDPAYPFRSHFSYNNMAYVVASKVIEKASGIPWPQFCEKQFFLPLGMNRTSLLHSALLQDHNVASAHYRGKPVPWQNWDALAAAAGINSCAQDMASWLLYCLNSTQSLTEPQKPQTLMESEGLFDPMSNCTWPIFAHEQKIVAYGFGWMMYSLGGKKILFHIGLSDGMQSIALIVPEEELGIAILTNQAPHLGTACLANELLDRFLDQDSVSWYEKGRASVADMNHFLQAQKTAFYDKAGENPPLPLVSYTGRFEHPAYGMVSISIVNEQLTITFWNNEAGILKPYNGNQFEIVNLPSGPDLPWFVEFESFQKDEPPQALKIVDLGVFTKKTSPPTGQIKTSTQSL